MSQIDNRKLNMLLYIAGLCIHTGIFLAVPFLPLYAADFAGSSMVMVSMIVTAASFGGVLLNIPAGILTTRYSSRSLLIAGGCSLLASSGTYLIAQDSILLLVAGFLQGTGMAIWSIARLNFMKHAFSTSQRGSKLAVYGGIFRISKIIGPLAGGFLAESYGFRYLFLGSGILAAAALILVLLKFPAVGTVSESGPGISDSAEALKQHLQRNHRVISGALIGILGLTVLRTGRTMFLPLWADSIGLSASSIGMVTSIMAAVEVTLVIPAGKILDNKGRKWAFIPTIVIMSVGLALMPLTGSFITLLLVSIIIGIGNGLGSGINMVLSTDLAPKKASGLFIGAWRTLNEAGAMAGPMAVGVIAQYMQLGASPVVLAIVGIASTIPVITRFNQKALK